MAKSNRRYATAVCLSGIFGPLGVHHFYLGRWFHGIADLSMTTSGFVLIIKGFNFLGVCILAIDFIHTFIVTILLLVGAYKDGRGHVVTYPGQKLKHTDN